METSSPFYFSCYYSLKNFNAKYTLWEVADVRGKILGTVECKHGSPRIFQISSLLRRWHRSSCTAFTGIPICYWSWWCSLVILIWCGKVQWKLKVWNTFTLSEALWVGKLLENCKSICKKCHFSIFSTQFFATLSLLAVERPIQNYEPNRSTLPEITWTSSRAWHTKGLQKTTRTTKKYIQEARHNDGTRTGNSQR